MRFNPHQLTAYSRVGGLSEPGSKDKDEIFFHQLLLIRDQLIASSRPVTRANLALESGKSHETVMGYLEKYPARTHILKVVGPKHKPKKKRRVKTAPQV